MALLKVNKQLSKEPLIQVPNDNRDDAEWLDSDEKFYVITTIEVGPHRSPMREFFSSTLH
jgi:hypothetical protein